MSAKQKSTALYKTPFCKGYWLDAFAELKDVRMLVFAALIIALRVALKMARIPLGANLDITPAFLANAIGAMIYGPVVGALGAIVSDFLGVMLRGDTYFLPYVLTEISSSVIFALFFYRQKITPTRAILSRFCICMLVNIVMQSYIDVLYAKVILGKETALLAVPRIIKNLAMFPIESVVLTVVLSAIQPVTARMHLTYAAAEKLTFGKKQIVLLVCLVLVAVVSVGSYPFYYYNHSGTSLSSGYSSEERMEANRSMLPLVIAESSFYDGKELVTVVESAYMKFPSGEMTYTVAIYELDRDQLNQNIADKKAANPQSTYSEDTLWGYSKTPATKDSALDKLSTATIVVSKSGEVLDYLETFVK